MPSSTKLSILITGCSPGGMGAALALAFHKAGHHVYATARNPSKLAALSDQGIQTLILDATSADTIAAAVTAVSAERSSLDMLVNNAASSYSMPISDISIDAARKLFEINLWGQLAVTQAFLPLLLKSANGGMIVNHTSVGSVNAMPFQGAYNASKAALAMLTNTMRLELAPFGMRVVDLKTGGVRTNIITNNNVNALSERLPASSIYEPAREIVDSALSQEGLAHIGITPDQWASEVSILLLQKSPPNVIWSGESAQVARIGGMLLPTACIQGMIRKITKLDVVEQLIRDKRGGQIGN